MIVGIATPTLVGSDAVGNDVMGMYHALTFTGHTVRLFANSSDVNATVENLSRFDGKMDAYIYHHSINCPLGIEALKSGDYHKIIKYHNITPPHFFANNPEVKKECELGLEQNNEIVKHNVWTDSDYNAQQLKKISPNLKYTVIPPFTQAEDLSVVEADFQGVLPFDDWNTNILMVGRVASNKDIMMGIKSFAEYLKINPYARLIIAGNKDGDYGVSVQEYAKQFGNKVVMTGKISMSKLKALYLLADALLITSLHEGFCVPLIEAMSLNVPVVVSNNCALPETAGNAAVVIKTHSPQDFAYGLLKVIGNIEMLKFGRERYRNNFHRSSIASKFLFAFGILTSMVRK